MSRDTTVAQVPSIGTVIVNFGTQRLLVDCIASVTQESDGPIVVVDNYKSAEDRAELLRLVAPIHLVLNSRNVGFGAACNIGASVAIRAGVTHLLFLNPDARLSRDCLPHMLAATSRRPSAMLSPKIVDGAGRLWFQGGGFDARKGTVWHSPETALPVDWLSGCALLIPTAIWERLGGFDERYFLYWEDVDVSRRWLSMGGELSVVTEATAIHIVGASQSAQPGATKSALYFYYNMRNRLLFSRLHNTRLRTLSWLLWTPFYMRLFVGRGLLTKDGRWLRLRAAMAGICHGLIDG